MRGGETKIAVAKFDKVHDRDIVTPETWRTAREFVDQLVPTKIPIPRGTNTLPRTVSCTARNPFDETVTGELFLSTPLGSQWEIAPRRIYISIGAKETWEQVFSISYNGEANDEKAEQWEARCVASLNVGL